jgi:hypothetical protein
MSSYPRHQMEVSGQLHPPPPTLRCKNVQYPLDKRLGSRHSRSGRGGEEKKNLFIAPAGNRIPLAQPIA